MGQSQLASSSTPLFVGSVDAAAVLCPIAHHLAGWTARNPAAAAPTVNAAPSRRTALPERLHIARALLFVSRCPYPLS